MNRPRPHTLIAAMLLCIAAFVFAGFPGDALARPHPLLTASAVCTVAREGRVEVVVRCDSLAFALGALPKTVDDAHMLALLVGPHAELDRLYDDGHSRFAEGFRLAVDGSSIAPRELIAPTGEQARAWARENPRATLPVKLEYTVRADLPMGSKSLALRFPEALGDVILTVQTPGEEPLAAPVAAGATSDAYTFNLNAPVIPGTVPSQVAPSTSTVSPAQVAQSSVGSVPATSPTPHVAAIPSVGSARSAMRFVGIGFEHIIPEGLDHILFVLGLFFLTPKLKPLLVQITCFTLAHSVTLALSASGIFSLPSSVVEPAIAASIAFVAIENLCTTKVHAWRPVIVFLFGLLHGLGFASAFAEALGTERAPLGPVLLFNVGVECGQLTVVGLALLAVGWFRKKKWYRPGIAVPASVLIACTGMYWFVQRAFLGG